MVKKAIKKSVRRKTDKVIKEKVKEEKKVEVKDESPKTVHIEVSHETVILPGPSSVTEISLPIHEGVKIVGILDSGHTKTHLKCAGVDRNNNHLTLHVPRELF